MCRSVPRTLSMGNVQGAEQSGRTGHGQHADYVFGWQGDSLQRAIDVEEGCFGATCQELETQAYEVANNCSVAPVVDEDFDGCEYLRLRHPERDETDQ